MARPRSTYPTELELGILKILWQAGPSTVAEVRELLGAGERRRELTHSSVITVMNIMVKKGYLTREKQGRAFQYAACVTDQQIHRGMLGDFMARVFDGSASAMMLELLETSDLDAAEIQAIRAMINQKAREP